MNEINEFKSEWSLQEIALIFVTAIHLVCNKPSVRYRDILMVNNMLVAIPGSTKMTMKHILVKI